MEAAMRRGEDLALVPGGFAEASATRRGVDFCVVPKGYASATSACAWRRSAELEANVRAMNDACERFALYDPIYAAYLLTLHNRDPIAPSRVLRLALRQTATRR